MFITKIRVEAISKNLQEMMKNDKTGKVKSMLAMIIKNYPHLSDKTVEEIMFKMYKEEQAKHPGH
jgi:hypothetical protein